MRRWRIPVKLVGTILVGLGYLITVAAVGSVILDARQAATPPFDLTDGTGGSSQGFVPILAPQSDAAGQLTAPTLPPLPAALTSAASATSTTAAPTSAASNTPPPTGQASATTRPTLTATPLPDWPPDRIVIAAIHLDAPIVPARLQDLTVQGKQYQEWLAPSTFAAGWLTSTAKLGLPGNTVLGGHHNTDGEVFGHLVDLKVGDLIVIYSKGTPFAYRVDLRMILPERFEKLAVRLANARWIGPSQDERLTLITCWPYVSNTHRLIIVAIPVNLDELRYNVVIPRLTPRPTIDWFSTSTPAP